MSRLIVEVCAVEEVTAHANADKLDLARVKGWWCVVPKGKYAVGDKVVYVPPDSVIPEALAERWGIAKYCPPLGRDISGERPPGLRIRATRLRGVSSFGTLQDPDEPSWSVGMDVREHYGVTKYEPPLRAMDGDAATPVAAFHEYTSIEAIGNYPNVFPDGEEVVVTEKIHGTSSRVGCVYHLDENGQPAWVWMAGSHTTRRKKFNDKGVRSKYWFPFATNEDTDPLRLIILTVAQIEQARRAVIVFAELFGSGIQDMQYGQKGLAFRVFDIAVDGRYLDWTKVEWYLAARPEIHSVPALYRGPYSRIKMDELVDGPTTICKPEDIREPFKGREGIVIKPTKERFSPELGGRAILKYVSADYHNRRNKNQTEGH